MMGLVVVVVEVVAKAAVAREDGRRSVVVARLTGKAPAATMLRKASMARQLRLAESIERGGRSARPAWPSWG